MKQKHTLLTAASGIFLLFLFFGGVWVFLVRFIPSGVPRAIVIIGLGAIFIGVFIWLLTSRLRQVMAGAEGFRLHVAMALIDLALLFLAFALVYQKLGIVDTTAPGSPVVHEFGTSVYYSVVTFTTLGYGDFVPTGLARVLAAMEAFTGYIILGIIASTAASIVSPYKKPGPVSSESDDDGDG